VKINLDNYKDSEKAGKIISLFSELSPEDQSRLKGDLVANSRLGGNDMTIST
tara:strand:- start:2916 stop:3071 length:156 start_codon:yes stop_codon:yes gene_type:complete